VVTRPQGHEGFFSDRSGAQNSSDLDLIFSSVYALKGGL
jgi:hypothetical protein